MVKSFPLNYLSFTINLSEIVPLISHKSFPLLFFSLFTVRKNCCRGVWSARPYEFERKIEKDIEIIPASAQLIYIIGVCKFNDMLLPSVLSPMQRNKIALYLSLGLGNFLACSEHLGQLNLKVSIGKVVFSGFIFEIHYPKTATTKDNR